MMRWTETTRMSTLEQIQALLSATAAQVGESLGCTSVPAEKVAQPPP